MGGRAGQRAGIPVGDRDDGDVPPVLRVSRICGAASTGTRTSSAWSVSLLCAVLGSLHGARAMLRLQPAAAMRPEPPARAAGSGWNDWAAGGQRLSATWRMTLRGLFRHRLRTLAGMFAAAMGAGLLVTGFMMTEIQSFLIDFQFHEILRSDIDLAFESERGEAAWTKSSSCRESIGPSRC